MKNFMLKHIIFLCAAFSFGALFSVTIKNEDILEQRLNVVARYNYFNQLNLKKNIEKKEKPLETRLCKYNQTGDIFVHLHDTGDHFGTILKIYDIEHKILASFSFLSPAISDCILSAGQHSDFVDIGNSINDYAFTDWVTLYERRTKIDLDGSENNVIKTVAFSPSGNSLLSVREKYVYCYNKEIKKELKWSRSGGRHAAFLNEKYMISLSEKSSKASVFSIEENPKESFLPQGNSYVPQQVVLSNDERILAIASSYKNENRLFTQIILYDAQTLQEKNKLYVPGELFSGKREEQHESIFFSPDDKHLFMHTLTQNDGINSWYIDVNSNNDYVRIKHSNDIKKLYELCGHYNFGGIEDKKVSIFDIRNQNRTIDLEIPNATHLALNPNVNSKTKAIIAVKGTTDLFHYT